MRDFVHICSFSDGIYLARSPSGKHSVLFEESERFGPSKVHPRTGDLTDISERLSWFWTAYPAWRDAGRPTVGAPLSSPIGSIQTADFATALSTTGAKP